MVCQKCSAVNTEDSVFCSECGCRLERKSAVSQPVGKEIQIKLPDFRDAAVRKKVGIPLLGIAGAIAVAAIAHNLISRAVSPEHAAETYFEAISTADWETAYQLLYVNESQFVNFEQYVKAMESDTSVPEAVASFDVAEAGQEISERFEGFGAGKQSKEDKEEAALCPEYRITYTTAESDSDTMTVSLLRTDEKKWLFFHTYKVSCADMLAPCTVYAPDYAEVQFDGVALTDGIQPDTDMGMRQYDTGSVFSGKHEVVVRSPFTEDYTVPVYEELKVSHHDLLLTQELHQQMFASAQQDFMKLFEDACTGKMYESTNPLYEGYFEDFLDVFYNAKETGNHDFVINSFYNKTEQEHLYSDMSYTCTIAYDYSYQYRKFKEEKQPYEEIDEDGNVKTKYRWVEVLRSEENSDTGYANFTYTYLDGNWQLTSVSNDV